MEIMKRKRNNSVLIIQKRCLQISSSHQIKFFKKMVQRLRKRNKIPPNMLGALLLFALAYLPSLVYSQTNGYNCTDTGDLFIESQQQCQACRALFPGCRRCETYYDSTLQQDVHYCAQCDEGMYIYNSSEANATAPAKPASSHNYCVPDCQTVNFQTVNNPSTMKCEYLGVYCKYGFSGQGCQAAYLQGDNITKLNHTDLTSTYVRSYFMMQIPAYVEENAGLVPNCWIGSMNTCKICYLGFVVLKQTINNEEVDTCVQACPDGMFPDLVSGSNQTQLYFEKQECSICHSTCNTCIGGTSLECSSCKPGQKLTLTDNKALTGYCENKNVNNNTYFINVVGRDLPAEGTNVSSLWLGIISAYQLTEAQNDSTVIIKMNSQVDHYITKFDFTNVFLMPKRYLINPTFRLYILPDNCDIDMEVPCDTKVTVYNKIGALLSFPAPDFGLYIRNIIFDAADSVIDPNYVIIQNTTKNNASWYCIQNSTEKCCNVDIDGRYVSCRSTTAYDGGITNIPTFFNKYQTCFTRPDNGLFELRPARTQQKDVKTIIIQDCEFQNFFYEFGSLVKLPKGMSPSFTVQLSNNKFRRINSCGAIISDNVQYNVTKNLTIEGLPANFSFEGYLSYYQFLDFSRQKYSKENFQTDLIDDSSSNKFIKLINNEFSDFNYLKSYNTEKDPSRMDIQLARVQTNETKHRGWIVDMYGGGDLALYYLQLHNNTFKNHLYFYKKLDGPLVYHCQSDFSEPTYNQFSLFGPSTYNKTIQQHHLISFSNISNHLIVLSDNNFNNISLLGPALYFEGAIDTYSQVIAIIGNTFNLIHSIMGTNVLEIRRQFFDLIQGQKLNPEDEFSKDHYSAYLQFGGSILIQENTFTEIVGCQEVDTSIASIIVWDVNGIWNGYEIGPQRRTRDMVPQGSFLLVDRKNLYTEIQAHIENDTDILYYYLQYRDTVLKVNSRITLFKGNQYRSVTMGTQVNIYGVFNRGCIHKLQNVMATDMIDEQYNDIMPFGEHNHGEVVKSIFQEDTNLENAGAQLSNTLIFINGMARLRILGENLFDNIALVDHSPEILIDTSSVYPGSFGLILFLINFKGSLQIGGQAPDYQEQPAQITTLSHFKGLINEFYVDKYPTWPYLDSFKYEFNNMTQVSILFNLIHVENQFIELKMENLNFEYIHMSNVETNPTYGIIDNQNGGLGTKRLILNNINISNCVYENGFGWMQLAGEEIVINQMTIKDIGLYRPYKDWSDEIVTLKQGESDRFSFFNIKLNNMYNEDPTILPDRISINRMLVENYYSTSVNSVIFQVTYNLDEKQTDQAKISTFTVTNSTFKSINGSQGTLSSIMYSNYGKPFLVNFFNVTFDNLTSEYGLDYREGDGEDTINPMIFDNCIFKNNKGTSSKLLHVNSFEQTEITIMNSKIFNEGFFRVNDDLQSNDLSRFTEASLIEIVKNGVVVIKNCNVNNIHYAKQGALAQVSNNGNLTILDSHFYSLSAQNGGLVRATSSSNITLQGSTFEDISAYQAGVIDIMQQSYLFIKNCVIKKNFAISSAVFRITSYSWFNITDSMISENNAASSTSIGSIIQIQYNSGFKNVRMISNQAVSQDGLKGQTGLEIILCNEQITFEQCSFVDNSAVTVTSNVFINSAQKVVMDGCTFQNTQGFKGSKQVRGNFLQVLSNSNLEIINSVLSKGYGFYGGAIYVLADSILIIKSSTFSENTAETNGGAIYAEAFDQIQVSDTQFRDNQAHTGSGDTIYMTNSRSNCNITGSIFYQTTSTNFLLAKMLTLLEIRDSVFSIKDGVKVQASSNQPSSQPSSISLDSIPQISIQGSTFRNLQMYSKNGGGALSITESTLTKNDKNRVNISSSTFENCQSTYGGAILLQDVGGVQIKDSKFTGNEAQKQGGAILFYCNDYSNKANSFQIDLHPSQCRLNLTRTTFVKNVAQEEGGALKWNFYEPTMENVKFEGNKAGVYGDDKASVPHRIVQIQKNQTELKIIQSSQRRRMLQEKEVDSVQSGGTIDLYFALVDKYDQVVKSDSKSMLYLSVNKSDSSMNKNISSSIESNTQFQSDRGIFKVEQLVFVGQPNSTDEIMMTTDGINYNIPDNKQSISNPFKPTQQLVQAGGTTNITNLGASNYSDSTAKPLVSSQGLSLKMNLRSCIEGEELLTSGKCRRCDPGTYLLEAYTKPVSCKNCPSSQVAACLGGNQVFPQPGYWRASRYSETFIECRTKSACIGQNPPVNNPLGDCQEGHQGILCNDCKPGYSKAGNSGQDCLRCPSYIDNVLRLLGLILLGVVVLVILVYSSLTSGDAKKNFLPVFIRILFNHLQLLMLTAQFELEWPSQIRSFFKAFTSVSEVSTQFISVDCLLDSRDPATYKYTVAEDGSAGVEDKFDLGRVFFGKLLIMALLPFIVIIGSYIAWTFIYAFGRIKEGRKTSSQKAKQPNATVKIQQKQPQLEDSSQQIKFPKGFNESFNSSKMDVTGGDYAGILRQQRKGETQRGDDDSNSDKESGIILKNNQVEDGPIDQPKKQITSTSQDETSNGDQSINGRIVQTIVIILFLIHPTIATSMLNAFNCQDIEGTLRLYQDLEIHCYQKAHNSIIYYIAIPCILLWGLGIPTIGMLIIFRNRHNLKLTRVRARFGFLYNGYKLPQGQYWEMFIMYRKIVLIFIQVFLIQQGKLVQALATLVFIAVCFTLNITKQPFTKPYLNGLESLSLISSGISVYCGLYFINDVQSKPNLTIPMTEDSKLFLFSLIVISHYLFAMYWLYHFVQEMRTTIRERFPKIYLAIFLCCREQRLQQELEVQKLMEYYAPFTVILEQVNNYLKERCQQYMDDKIPNDEEELKSIMNALVRFVDKQEKRMRFKQGSALDQQRTVHVEKVVRDQRIKDMLEKKYKRVIQLRQQEQLQIDQGLSENGELVIKGILKKNSESVSYANESNEGVVAALGSVDDDQQNDQNLPKSKSKPIPEDHDKLGGRKPVMKNHSFSTKQQAQGINFQKVWSQAIGEKKEQEEYESHETEGNVGPAEQKDYDLEETKMIEEPQEDLSRLHPLDETGNVLLDETLDQIMHSAEQKAVPRKAVTGSLNEVEYPLTALATKKQHSGQAKFMHSQTITQPQVALLGQSQKDMIFKRIGEENSDSSEGEKDLVHGAQKRGSIPNAEPLVAEDRQDAIKESIVRRQGQQMDRKRKVTKRYIEDNIKSKGGVGRKKPSSRDSQQRPDSSGSSQKEVMILDLEDGFDETFYQQVDGTNRKKLQQKGQEPNYMPTPNN